MFDYITIFIAQFIIAFIEHKFSFPRIKSKNNIGETNDIEESKYYRKKLSFTSNIFNVINYWLFHLTKNYKFYEIIKTEYILLDERSILFENGKRPTYFDLSFEILYEIMMIRSSSYFVAGDTQSIEIAEIDIFGICQ